MSQTHLKSASMPYAKRYHKIPCFLRGNCNHTLWWTVVNSPILSKTQDQMVPIEVCKEPSILQILFYLSTNYFCALLYRCRNIAYRQHTDIAIQWCIQKATRCRNISQSYFTETFFTSPATKSYSSNCQSTQYNSTEVIFPSLYSNQRHIRYRSNSNYSLWQTAKSQSWIQSQKARQKMLFAIALLRIQSSRVLDGQSTFREYPSCKISQGFFKQCIVKLPKPVKRIRVRTDSSFFDHKFINFLDDNGIGYTIEAQPTKPLCRIAYSLKYQHYKKDWEVGDFIYQSKTWKTPHRFVVQRRPLPENPEEKSQLSLFVIKDYGYRTLITNLKLKPRHVWNFHNQRAKGAELNIKELKNSYLICFLKLYGKTQFLILILII